MDCHCCLYLKQNSEENLRTYGMQIDQYQDMRYVLKYPGVNSRTEYVAGAPLACIYYLFFFCYGFKFKAALIFIAFTTKPNFIQITKNNIKSNCYSITL